MLTVLMDEVHHPDFLFRAHVGTLPSTIPECLGEYRRSVLTSRFWVLGFGFWAQAFGPGEGRDWSWAGLWVLGPAKPVWLRGIGLRFLAQGSEALKPLA